MSKQKCFNMSCLLSAESVCGFDPNSRTGYAYLENAIFFQKFGIFVLIIRAMVGRGEEGLSAQRIRHCQEMHSARRAPLLQLNEREGAHVFRIHLN